MSGTCDWCGGYIETSNRSHPGYCSPDCRDAEQQERRDARRRRHEGEGGSELHDRDRRVTLPVSPSLPTSVSPKPIKNGASS